MRATAHAARVLSIAASDESPPRAADRPWNEA